MNFMKSTACVQKSQQILLLNNVIRKSVLCFSIVFKANNTLFQNILHLAVNRLSVTFSAKSWLSVRCLMCPEEGANNFDSLADCHYTCGGIL